MALRELVSTASCSATTTTLTGDGTVIDNDTLSTGIATSISYMLTGCSSEQALMNQANSYMESMSIVELQDFELAVDQELEILMSEAKDSVNEIPKVFTKK